MKKKALLIGVCFLLVLTASISIVKIHRNAVVTETKFQEWKKEKTGFFKQKDASLTNGIRNAEKFERASNLPWRLLSRAFRAMMRKSAPADSPKEVSLPTLTTSQENQYRERFSCELEAKEVKRPKLIQKCRDTFDSELALFSCGDAVDREIENEINTCTTNHPLEEEKVLAKKEKVLGDLTNKTMFNLMTNAVMIKSVSENAPSSALFGSPLPSSR